MGGRLGRKSPERSGEVQPGCRATTRERVIHTDCHWRPNSPKRERIIHLYRRLARSQERWQTVFIAERWGRDRDNGNRIDSCWDQLYARHDIEHHLAWMARHEFLAEKWEQLATGVIPERERRRLRDRYAELYWTAVGVPPDLRGELRSALEANLQSGDQTVDEIVAEMRHRAYSIPELSTGGGEGSNKGFEGSASDDSAGKTIGGD